MTNAQPMRVLAVDDNDMNLFILAKNLKKTGFEVVEADSAPKAWETLEAEANNISFVLLDRMMAHMDGLEIAKKMQQHDTLKLTPIIIESGKVGASIFEEAEEAGASYYLVKPFDNAQMAELCHAALFDVVKKQNIQKQLEKANEPEEQIECHTHHEALVAIANIASASATPLETALGLYELVLNIFEHEYMKPDIDEKRQAFKEGKWATHFFETLAPLKTKNPIAFLFSRKDDMAEVTIGHEGQGFSENPSAYSTIYNISKPTGHGLRKAMKYLSSVDFKDNGNTILCRFPLK